MIQSDNAPQEHTSDGDCFSEMMLYSPRSEFGVCRFLRAATPTTNGTVLTRARVEATNVDALLLEKPGLQLWYWPIKNKRRGR